jgi:uncharacterized OB-fold protein
MAITRETFPLPDVDDPLVAPFFAAAARDELAITRCASCGRYVWYPTARCSGCESDRIEWVPVRGDGTLFTWVVVRHSFLPAFESMVPFVTALVALDEDPAVRLCSYLLGADGAPADPDRDHAAGAPVRAVFRDLQFATVPGRAVRVPYFQLQT